MKTLIFRSAPIKRFVDTLNLIRKNEGQETFIGVVTHSNTNPEMVDHNPLELFNYKGSKINIFSLGLKTILKVRNERFNKAIILCINHLGDGYENIMFAALLSGAGKVELWNVKGDVVPVTWALFFRRVIGWNLELLFYSLIWLALFVASTFRKVTNAHRN